MEVCRLGEPERAEEDSPAPDADRGAGSRAAGHDRVRLVAVERDPHERDLAAGLHPHHGVAISLGEEQLPRAQPRAGVVGLDAALDVTLDVRAATCARSGHGVEDVQRRPRADHRVALEVEDVRDASVAQRRVRGDETVGLCEVRDRAREVDAPQSRRELVRIGVVRCDVDERLPVGTPLRRRVHEAVLGQPARLGGVVGHVEDVDVLDSVVEHPDLVEPPHRSGDAIRALGLARLLLRAGRERDLGPVGRPDSAAADALREIRQLPRLATVEREQPELRLLRACRHEGHRRPVRRDRRRRVRRVAERQPPDVAALDVEQMQIGVLDLVVVFVLAGGDPRLREDDLSCVGRKVGGDDEPEAEQVFRGDRACHRCLLVLAGRARPILN